MFLNVSSEIKVRRELCVGFQFKTLGAGWGVASSSAKCLPSMQKAPGSIPRVGIESKMKPSRSLASGLSAGLTHCFSSELIGTKSESTG